MCTSVLLFSIWGIKHAHFKADFLTEPFLEFLDQAEIPQQWVMKFQSQILFYVTHDNRDSKMRGAICSHRFFVIQINCQPWNQHKTWADIIVSSCFHTNRVSLALNLQYFSHLPTSKPLLVSNIPTKHSMKHFFPPFQDLSKERVVHCAFKGHSVHHIKVTYPIITHTSSDQLSFYSESCHKLEIMKHFSEHLHLTFMSFGRPS